ncbi:autophagy protein 13 [Coemansia interrupta]|uniref:Autophagy-related protein 13 n=1 Tax=Coemansia interrupta TaxID=1126814 RepID=A0A9W8H3J2_9FUNG|nr:autophagy protein 13 [Coemansia interrupta]
MTQRTAFWSRHGSSSSDGRKGSGDQNDGIGKGAAQSGHADNYLASNHAHDAGHNASGGGMQPRLPRNSGSPTMAAASSFSSHYSSSPSPSPSINPFRGVSEASVAASGGRARGATVSTMPANIRRSEGGRQPQQPQPQPPQQRPPTRSSSVSVAERDARCEQIVQSFYSKAAQVVGQLRGGAAQGSRRLGRSSGYGSGPGASDWALNVSSTSSLQQQQPQHPPDRRRSNRWFNLCLDDLADIRDEASVWRQAVASAYPAPPPMFIDVCVDVSRVGDGELLQVTDIFGRAWAVDLDASADGGRAAAIVVETWRLDLDGERAAQPDLPRVYKQAIVFFRSLYAFASLLPATALARHVAQRSDGALSMFCVFRADAEAEAAGRAGVVGLDAGLTGTDKFLEAHAFAPVATPLGAFTMAVRYRRECQFTVAPGHAGREPDAYGGAGAMLDDAYFAPTLSPQPRPQPVSQRTVAVPSVNPFRARPLSLGESSSLPGMIAQARGGVSPGHSSRRESLGTRGVVASEPVTGMHAGDAGSVLHRSVMLRRFGDGMSPGEQGTRGFESGSVRSVSSGGSTGGSAGVAPFRSPSLSESPGAWRARWSAVVEPVHVRAESVDVGSSAASSRSRGLASSFGNRRASRPMPNPLRALSISSSSGSGGGGVQHVREAAAGRDHVREPQLPMPVNIPGGSPGRRLGVRGRSQPPAYGPLEDAFVPRMTTPQPHAAMQMGTADPKDPLTPPLLRSTPPRPNFPPLSFIVPRARVEQAGGTRPAPDDDDLMFQMDGSLH